MSTHKHQPLPSPLHGVDMRFIPENPNAVAWAYNLNFSRQPVECRHGLEVFANVDEAQFIQTLVARNGKKYVCIMTDSGADASPILSIRNASGGSVAQITISEFNGIIQAGRRNWGRCVFQGCLLFSTRDNSVMRWDPLKDETSVELLPMQDGVNEPNVPYLQHPPRSSFMFVHANRVFYGGFGDQFSMVASRDIPTDEPGNAHHIQDWMIDAANSAVLEYRRNHIIYSDPGNVSEMAADQYIYVEDEHDVTAGIAYRGYAYIFTERSIWQLSGYSPSNMQLSKVVNGVGCVSHDTLLEGEDGLYFLAYDGVYRFDGNRATKVTESVDPVFRAGRAQHGFAPASQTGYQVPNPMPKACVPGLKYAKAGIFWPDSQYMVALPVSGGAAVDADGYGRRLILVYDWKRKSTFFYGYGTNDSDSVTCFGRGPVTDDLYIGSNYRHTYRYGANGTKCDVYNGANAAIPTMLVTRRYGTEDQDLKDFSKVRLVMHATGANDSTSAQRIKWWALESETGRMVRSGHSAGDSGIADLEPHPHADDVPVYDDSTLWGALGTYRGTDAFVVDLPIGQRCRWFQLGLYQSNQNRNDIVVYGLGVDYKRLRGRQ